MPSTPGSNRSGKEACSRWGYVVAPFFGSRITEKDVLILMKKEFAIPVTAHRPLNDLYSLVYPRQLPRVHRPGGA